MILSVKPYTIRMREGNRLFLDLYLDIDNRRERVKVLFGLQLSRQYSVEELNAAKLKVFSPIDQPIIKEAWNKIGDLIDKKRKAVIEKKIKTELKNKPTIHDIAEDYILARNFAQRSSSASSIRHAVELLSLYMKRVHGKTPHFENVTPEVFYDYLLARVSGKPPEERSDREKLYDIRGHLVEQASLRTLKLDGQNIINVLKKGGIRSGIRFDQSPYKDILSDNQWSNHKKGRNTTEGRSMEQIQTILEILYKEHKSAFKTTLFHIATGIDHIAMFYDKLCPDDYYIKGVDIQSDDYGHFIKYARLKTDVVTYKRIPDKLFEIIPSLQHLKGTNMPLFVKGKDVFNKSKTYKAIEKSHDLKFQFRIKNVRKSIATEFKNIIPNSSQEDVISSMYLGHTQKDIKSRHYTDHTAFAEPYASAINSIVNKLLTNINKPI